MHNWLCLRQRNINTIVMWHDDGWTGLEEFADIQHVCVYVCVRIARASSEGIIPYKRVYIVVVFVCKDSPHT